MAAREELQLGSADVEVGAVQWQPRGGRRGGSRSSPDVEEEAAIQAATV